MTRTDERPRVARHLEFLVEEPSMEAFLRGLLPRLLPEGCSFAIHAFQGKMDLLARFEERLRGYAAWLPPDWRIVVVVDRDQDDCHALKEHLEAAAEAAGLTTRRRSVATWQVVTRLAIEELEAWYFGDWDAVVTAFPRLSRNIPSQRRYRDPDAIEGGTWEALEGILRRRGYFKAGLPKIEVARTLGRRLDPDRCRSASFRCFRDAVREATGQGTEGAPP